jgi:hypothetical protein
MNFDELLRAGHLAKPERRFLLLASFLDLPLFSWEGRFNWTLFRAPPFWKRSV